MPSKKEIERLERARDRARSDERKLRDAIRDEIESRVSAFEGQVREEVEAKFKSELDEAIAGRIAAHEALTAALTERALAGADAPYPIGTKLYQWDKFHGWRKEWKRTGKFGIVEPVTESTVHSATLSKYGCADIGEFVIRLLKKDGTPSTNYVKFNDWRSGKWLPEGEKPKADQ